MLPPSNRTGVERLANLDQAAGTHDTPGRLEIQTSGVPIELQEVDHAPRMSLEVSHEALVTDFQKLDRPRAPPVLQDSLMIGEPPGHELPGVDPGVRLEAGKPPRNGDVAQISAANDDAGTRPQNRDQAEQLDVVGHLVGHACGAGWGKGVQAVEVSLGCRPGGLGTEQFQGLERVDPRLTDPRGQALKSAQDVEQLTRTVDFRVRGKDLLDQGGTRPGQTDHKDRSRIGIHPATPARDEVRCERSNQSVDELRMLIGVAVQVPRDFQGGLDRIGGFEVRAAACSY